MGGRELVRVEGEVVATAPDGAFVVRTRAGYVAYSPDLRSSAPIPVGSSDAVAGELVSISPGARWLAHVQREGWVSVYEIASGRQVWRKDPGPSPSRQSMQWLAGPRAQALLSTGAPVFVGADTVLTLHPGAVVAHGVGSGERSCALTDRAMGMVRTAVPLDDDRVAVSSGSFGNPEFTNQLWVILSLNGCRVVNRYLAWPDDRVGAARTGSRVYLASKDRVRIIEGERHSVLRLDSFARRFAASSDGSHLFFGMDGGQLSIWNTVSERLSSLHLSTDAAPLHLWASGDSVYALATDGRLLSFPIPDTDAGARVRARSLTTVERQWEHAVIEAGVGEPDEAMRLLAPFEAGDGGVRYRAPAAYVRAILSSEDPAQFRSRTRAEGIDFADAGVFEVAESFAEYQLTIWGADILLYHFRDRGEGLDGGAETGVELARQLGEVGETDLEDILISRLAELYPGHLEVQEIIADAAEFAN